MSFLISSRCKTVAHLLVFALFAVVIDHPAYSQAVPQVTGAVDPHSFASLKGTVHALVRNGAKDLGAVPDNAPTGTLTLLLQRPAAQEQQLQQFLRQAHTPGSPTYHQWLTPQQFGQTYGVADSDMTAVQGWLQSQGLKIEKVSSGKNTIEFSGTAGQVGTAFHTSLHAYTVNGETHHANASELQVPTALRSVIASVGPVNDFHPRSQAHLLGKAQFNPANHKLNAQFTLSVSNYLLGLAPEDLATQYDIKPLYRQGITGAGQTIGIINESNINLDIVAAYRNLFKLDANPAKPNLPQVIVEGNDPGNNGAAIEAYLDVEVSGAIAPQAQVLLYTSAGSDYSDGLTLAIMRAVEDDRASVLSLSFGECEAFDTAQDAFMNAEWEQAAAQGQTVMVSSGDAASAGCDFAGEQYAQLGRQVNGLASTPWNIAVGGTDFNYPGGLSSILNFWNQTNDGQQGSLLQSLPEQPWNDSIYAATNLSGEDAALGGGGGQSACAIPGPGNDPLNGTITFQGDTFTLDCAQYVGYPKPSWQSGLGVPNDGVRDLPDVSLFASSGNNGSFYVICQAPGDCTSPNLSVPGELQVTAVGGTSASAPAFAGMMALVNQLYGPQGQANTVLYPLAQRVPSAFHDITIGSNNAPCDPTASPSFECTADATGGTYSIGGFSATPGYDMATGLGSIDAYQLVTNWNKVTFKNSSTQLLASSRRFEHGEPITLGAVVTGEGSGGTKPTGNVALTSNLPQYASTGLGIIPLDATGSGTITTNQLPGGTYQLNAVYSGDSKYNGSESAPVTFDIGPEDSVIRPSAEAYSVSYPGGQTTLTDLGPIKNGAAYPYGTYFFVDLKVTGSHEPATTAGTPATGSTTIFDNGITLSTNSLDVTGSSSYSNLAVPVGRHRLQYSYSGDSSYLPTTATSPAGALNFTVAKAPSQISGSTGSLSLIQAGSSYVYFVNVSGPGGGAPPTGQVTFQLGNLPAQTVDLRANLGSTPEPGSGVSFAGAFYSNIPAGTYAMQVSYSGDQNLTGSTLTGPTLTVGGDGGLVPATVGVTLTSNAGSGPIVPSTVLDLNITVSGGTGATVAPTGYFAIVDDTSLVGIGILPSSSTGSATAKISIVAGGLLAGVNHLLVLYVGDTNYLLAYSPLFDYTMDAADFTLAAITQNVSVRPGNSPGSEGVGFVQLQGLDQFSGLVNLSCAVTGGPAGNTALPQCIVPSAALVPSSRPSSTIVRFDAKPVASGGRISKTVPVPPGTYTAVITGQTVGAKHDVAITITVE
jgi:trimeric autotransporter adhesin